MSWWPWLPRQTPTLTREGTGQSPGCCEFCGDHGMICLNGQRFLCWDHYCVEMERNALKGNEDVRS
jgi:hypothetical protein